MFKGKKSLLIFGAGPLQCSIIKVAKNNDYYTIAIDPDKEAVGKVLAAEFYVIDGQDYESTLQIAHDYDIDGLVTSATDKPLLMMAKIAQELKLPFPNYDSILNTIDKSLFKENLIKCALPHASGTMIFQKKDLENITYPAVLKPKDSSGSRGVIICNNIIEARVAYDSILSLTGSEGILAEDYLTGDEISVECLVSKGEVFIIQITDKVTTNPPYNVEMVQIQPSKYYGELFASLHKMIQKVVIHLGLDNCALHPEFKIEGDRISFIEMGPRLGGDFITSHLTPLSTGINIELELIKIATSVFNEKEFHKSNNSSLVKYLELRSNRVVKKVDRKHIADITNKLEFYSDILEEGFIIPEIENSLDRYGQFIISGKSREEIIKESKKIESEIISAITLDG